MIFLLIIAGIIVTIISVYTFGRIIGYAVAKSWKQVSDGQIGLMGVNGNAIDTIIDSIDEEEKLANGKENNHG